MTDRALQRIAIVNRGEAAMRLINAVRELRHEHQPEVRAIALHTQAERTAMFVREADEAVCLDDDLRPPDAGSPYLDLAALRRALVVARADAAWVGWGFVAERPEFAELCAELGVTFIGPTAAVMRRLGDKIGAKRLAEEAGVPVAPWSGDAVDTVGEARAHAERIGYPLMIKATSGGGGRGIRRVDHDHDGQLAAAFESARAEGAKAFGDPTVFMERVVTGARHVEVQVIADEHGTAWAVGVRDCSLQRRNQKVIEESQCMALTADQDAELRASAVRLVKRAGYVNAGTVEFLYQPDERQFAFLEVNTRLQVEHPVTELTTGLDLVKLQLHVAAGGRLDGDPPPTEGYAVEARLNAEDPQRGFAPAPGVIDTLTLPAGPGIRVDTGVAEGDVIPPEYDSMVAKVIAHGRDRSEAMARLQRALSQMVVLVGGGTTNKSFLLDLLQRPEVRTGDIDTGWLDRLTAADEHLPTRHGDVALVVAAIDAAAELDALDRSRFLEWAERGRPLVDGGVGHEVEFRHRAASYTTFVRRLDAASSRVRLGAHDVTARLTRLGRARSRCTIGLQSFAVVSSIQGNEHLIEIDGVAHRFSRDDAGVVRAPAAALVVRVDTEIGRPVEAGDRLLTVEAMKMEIAIVAPVAGRVTDVLVARNVQVDAGTPLVRIEQRNSNSNGAAGAASPSAAIDLAELSDVANLADPARTDRRAIVRAFLLGFDVTAAEAREAQRRTVRDLDALVVFADLCALEPERRAVDGTEVAPREYFNTYLRSLDAEREGLPNWFVERLERAVAHYGIADLHRTEALEEAMLRLNLTRVRRPAQVTLVLGILESLLGTDTLDEPDPALRDALDRLIETTQRRHSAVASMARAVRHRHVDRPVIERNQRTMAADMRTHIETLTGGIDCPDRDARVDELVTCPMPIIGLFDEEDRLTSTDDPALFLEIIVRRYYKIRALRDVHVTDVHGFAAVRASYDHRDRTVDVIAVRARPAELDAALAAVATMPTTGGTLVVDVLVPLSPGADDALAEPTALSDHVAARLAAVALAAHVTRVAVIAATPDVAPLQLTFRRARDDGDRPFWMQDDKKEEAPSRNRALAFAEDVKFRGLHPMVARRLQMWRLANFDLTRLPSPDELYLFDCVARENPSDERLVAVAEVRDITAVRDDDGRVVSLPGVEHVLVGCLDAIRQALNQRPHGGNRLEWNRVMLYIWPVVTYSYDEMTAIARRLAPLTEDLGLEQVVVSARLATPGADAPADVVLRLGYEPGRGLSVQLTDPPTAPLQPLDDYTRKRIQTRRRGLAYPYELVSMLAGEGGRFVEHDLDDRGDAPDRDDRLVPIDRPAGANRAGIVVGVVSTPTSRYREGMTRVVLLGDPTKAMGSITEAECRRVLAAIDLAEQMDVPIEWFALSAGAKIAMDSGSENLDWVARVLRRLVEHTQAGGEVNVVVAGINVGAQPYWNAEATMLMHTRGILVMTPDSAMVLTGKQAIDYSGGVSAEDNFGIGGYARIMGPNGEAQYFAPSLAAACDVLFRHYELTYRAPGERWPRPAPTTDPRNRDVRPAPHHVEGSDFTTVGDIFSDAHNRDRKKPFDIRTVMQAVIDADHESLERWPEMAETDTAVVIDARLGGHAVTVVGIESRPVPRHGVTPADGPAQWSAGTLFPLSSKKIARAVNAASGCRPVVMLANLSGFDGSPESLRRLQLEYGAEIGRAIVNFDGPFVLCVVSRYHGGAFVVFSATLNDDMEVLAVEGSFASVIGGAPAAAVVFTRDVDARTRSDEQVIAAQSAVTAAPPETVDVRRAELAEVRETVRVEKLGEVAAEFDAVHSVQRAQDVGSVHRIISAARLRPELIDAVERGMVRIDERRRGS